MGYCGLRRVAGTQSSDDEDKALARRREGEDDRGRCGRMDGGGSLPLHQRFPSLSHLLSTHTVSGNSFFNLGNNALGPVALLPFKIPDCAAGKIPVQTVMMVVSPLLACALMNPLTFSEAT